MFERKSLGRAQFVAWPSIGVREKERPRDETGEKVAVF